MLSHMFGMCWLITVNASFAPLKLIIINVGSLISRMCATAQ